jgi:hypothetical protein
MMSLLPCLVSFPVYYALFLKIRLWLLSSPFFSVFSFSVSLSTLSPLRLHFIYICMCIHTHTERERERIELIHRANKTPLLPSHTDAPYIFMPLEGERRGMCARVFSRVIFDIAVHWRQPAMFCLHCGETYHALRSEIDIGFGSRLERLPLHDIAVPPGCRAPYMTLFFPTLYYHGQARPGWLDDSLRWAFR